LRLLDRHRLFHHDRPRRLVLAQGFEARLPQQPVARDRGKFDFSDEFGFHPCDLTRARRFDARGERRLRPLQSVQRPQQRSGILPIEACADAAEIEEILIPIGADQDGTEFRRASPPAPDHHFLPAAAFLLGPKIAASGTIRRIKPLGDDAFELGLARRFQESRAIDREMLDIAQTREALGLCEQARQHVLAGGKFGRA